VLSYLDVLLERKPVGKRVAVIGAGGIGFDVSEFLVHQGVATSLDRDAFWKEWGIDTHLEARGGVAGIKAEPHAPAVKCSCCSARNPRSATAWARPPAGFTAPV
jgi:2,4-dienoyl-CoA reductase (NADPH2)